MENKNDLESVNNPDYKNNLKDKFLKEFNKNILSSNNKNDYLDDIMNKDSIEDSTLLTHKTREIKAYNDELKDFDINDLNIYDLRRGLSKEALKIENLRVNYLENTFINYDLDEKQRKKLDQEIKTLKDFEIEKLIFAEEKNDYFLKKVFKKTPNKIKKLNFLDNLTTDEIRNRLSKYPKEEKKEIEVILTHLNSGRVYDSDIRELFSFNFFTKEEKKEILDTFIPYISLSDAVNLDFLSKKEAENRKKDILYALLKKKKISGNYIDDIIKKASLSDFKIKSSEVFNKEENLDKIAEEIGFSNVEDSFKSLIEDYRKEIEEKGPQSFDELKTQLSSKKYETIVESLGNFNENGIIKQVYKDSEGKEKISYLKINDVDNQNKKIFLKPIGDDSSGKEIINFSSHANTIDLGFVDFIKVVEKSNNITFFIESDLQKKIELGEIDVENSDINFYTKQDLKNDEFREELTEKHKGNLNEELENLQREKEEVDNELGDLKKQLEKQKDKEKKEEIKNRIDVLNTKKGNLEIKIDEVQDELNELDNASLSTNKLLEIGNKDKLIEKLDSIDVEGVKFGLKKGMFITSKNGIYEIKGIDWESGEIDLLSTGKGGVKQNEKLSFEEFYQAFKKNEASRSEKFDNLNKFLEYNQKEGKNKETWEDYEIKNGELHLKEKNLGEFDDKNTHTEYLISGKNLIKIQNISGDKITISFGEYKKAKQIEEEVANDPNKKNKYAHETIKENGAEKTKFSPVVYLDKTEYTYNLNEFNRLINKKDEDYVPDNKIGKAEPKPNPKAIQNKFHGSFSTRFFNGLALVDIIQGGKFMVEGVEEYFKKGTELRAARFGLGLGKLLPEEVREDLLIKVEAKEKESMDKEIESLGKVDSWVATKRIAKWLLNKDTAEYKKEAGLIFMLKKYGHLTAKAGLAQYKGKFLWYEAFGGRIGDEFYLEMKQKAKDENKTFSEEQLMFILMKKQCSKSGYNGIKRRTRLHKEYKNLWPQGITDEQEKGAKDAKDERTARAMVDAGIGEMKGGTIANSVGWLLEAIKRGGTLEEMNEGFFTLLYSGAIYNLDKKVYLNIKSLWTNDHMPAIMARFSSYETEMKLFNRTVLELSKRIGEEYSKEFPNIRSEAQSLFDDALNQNGKEPDRISKAQEFWHKYGTPLSRALNMNHNNSLEYTKTDKIIILEKDNNDVFNDYFNKVRSFTTNEDPFSDDFLNDSMGEEGAAGLNINRVLKKYAQLYTGGTLRSENKSVVGRVWRKLSDDVNSVNSKEFINGNSDKKKYLKFIIQEIIGAFIANNGGSNYLMSYVNKSPFKDDMARWGITEDILMQFNEYSADSILKGEEPGLKRLLDHVVDYMVSGAGSGKDHYESGFKIVDKTKYQVANNIQKEEDEDEFLDAA